ncbi:ROK family protein [Rhodobacteraceae bacterium CCMM004]|nr:ROK family protein [Rhodobacteraceae bacterium CCMM004]
MIAAGIDLGGTKIEAQVFDPDWRVAARRRTETPRDYPALVAAVADQIAWIEGRAGVGPVGLSAAGLVVPRTGLALTANLVATGHPFPRDIEAAAGRHVLYLNDCRAFALSEAVFGAGRGCRSVFGLILGTGVGGGHAVEGRLAPDHSGAGGEVGHLPLSAELARRLDLPPLPCGCGRTGCVERYLAGPGLARLAQALTGREATAQEVAAGRRDDPDAARVWAAWCALAADLLMSITLTVDPQIVVLGGGVSRIEGMAEDLAAALRAVQFDGFAIPEIRVAEGGDASGARGAAYAAWLAAGGGDG